MELSPRRLECQPVAVVTRAFAGVERVTAFALARRGDLAGPIARGRTRLDNAERINLPTGDLDRRADPGGNFRRHTASMARGLAAGAVGLGWFLERRKIRAAG